MDLGADTRLNDPLPFAFLGKQPELCENTTFVDVDYPVLMQNKCGIISNTEQLHGLLENFYRTSAEEGVLGAGNPYLAVGCDLRDIELLRETLQDAVEIEDDAECTAQVQEYLNRLLDNNPSKPNLLFLKNIKPNQLDLSSVEW